jgi:hypothetical protein
MFSCGQSELPAITDLVLKPDIVKNVKELDILMHFLIDTAYFERLMSALKAVQNVERLRIEYLDLDDDSWTMLCSSLTDHPSLKYLNLAFTEKFADNIRRLTPERRTSRSKTVHALVEASPTLLKVDWPVFQQDEVVAEEIKKILQSRNQD